MTGTVITLKRAEKAVSFYNRKSNMFIEVPNEKIEPVDTYLRAISNNLGSSEANQFISRSALPFGSIPLEHKMHNFAKRCVSEFGGETNPVSIIARWFEEFCVTHKEGGSIPEGRKVRDGFSLVHIDVSGGANSGHSLDLLAASVTLHIPDARAYIYVSEGFFHDENEGRWKCAQAEFSATTKNAEVKALLPYTPLGISVCNGVSVDLEKQQLDAYSAALKNCVEIADSFFDKGSYDYELLVCGQGNGDRLTVETKYWD